MKGVGRLDHVDAYLELARRGVLDPDTHIQSSGGALKPTISATLLVDKSVSILMDLGLVDRYKPHRYTRVVMLTQNGKETLEDWDDTAADGLWPR